MEMFLAVRRRRRSTGIGSPAAAIVLNPIALTFPSTTINATSPAQNITISNTSGILSRCRHRSVAGTDFKITANTCGASLGPSTGCTVAIAFMPTASGTRSGTFTITDDAGTQTASLSGIGTSPATDALSPLALTFAPQQITTASVAQQIMLTNSGDLPLTLIAAQITSGDFTVVNACGNSLNPHSSCSMNVAFQPKNIGTIYRIADGLGSVSHPDRHVERIGVAPPGVSLSPFSTITFPATGSWCHLRCANSYTDEQWRRSAACAEHRDHRRFRYCAWQKYLRQQLLQWVQHALCRLRSSPTAGGPRSGTLDCHGQCGQFAPDSFSDRQRRRFHVESERRHEPYDREWTKCCLPVAA